MLRAYMQDGIAATFCDYEDLTVLKDETPMEINKHMMEISLSGINQRGQQDGGKWYGGLKSRKQAEDMLLDGWTEGRKRSEDMADSLAGSVPAAESIRRRVQWGDDGESFCIDRGIAGEWDMAFATTPLVRTNGSRILTLVGPVGGSASRSPEELFWTGVQLVVLTALFEEAGYQCEVMGMISLHQNGVPNASFITAKRAGEPLRIDQLASVFAHAGVFRSFGFELICHAKTAIAYGHGNCEYALHTMQGRVDKLAKAGLMPEGAIVIGEAYTKESAIANIRSVIDKVTGQAVTHA